MDEPGEPRSEHVSISDNDSSGDEAIFNDSPTLPVSFVVDTGGNQLQNIEIPPVEEADAEEVSAEEAEDDATNGEISNNDWHLPVSPLSFSPATTSSSPSSSPSAPSETTPLPKMKVTMSFMQAYKAMRGPRDVEPSPLFGCFVKSSQKLCNGDSAGQEMDDDPFKLAGRDEVKFSLIHIFG